MKKLIKLVIMITCLSMLSGCYNSVVRFWNNGYMSEKRSNAYSECFREARLQNPALAKNNLTDSENAEFSHRVALCMKKKGF